MEDKFKILKYFRYEHLPEHLQKISEPFYFLAHAIAKGHEQHGGDIAEVITGLRKLLEAKDCIVRSKIK